MKPASITMLFIFLFLPVRAAWNSPEMGNPLIPGYFADPSMLYDSTTNSFYIYSTTDGLWISYSAWPQVWSSSDFINWKCHPITLPSFWPKAGLWAPSAMRHPTNGKCYLMYCAGSAVYIAYSSTPLGPWTNAVSGNNPLYRSGNLTGTSDWIDPQFFIDTNTVYFSFGQSSNMGVAKLVFNATTFLASIDGSDERMIDGVTYKCKRLAGLSNNLEGSCMFKKDGRYFITYSNSACQNYNVRYAVASSPVGPFTYINRIIVQRDNNKAVLGPGHNSIMQYGNNWYIIYHRQHYQYVDVKRQACIDQITFNGDNISAGVQTQEGVWQGSGSIETLVASSRAKADTDLAFGKTVLASSESAYKGGTSGNINESFSAVQNFYAAEYAVDRNNGTRWAPATLPGYLIVDLGMDYPLNRCETTFEHVMWLYKYRIEYLAHAEAAGITAAQGSTAWHSFADRSANTQDVSPVVDSAKVTARYLKTTVLSAALPTATNEIRTIVETDYADRVSIVEFKAFGEKQVGVRTAAPSMARNVKNPDVAYEMKQDGSVEITLINTAGRTVLRRMEIKQRGIHVWNLRNAGVKPGVYICEITMPDGRIGGLLNLTR
jgi:hypothetical protein